MACKTWQTEHTCPICLRHGRNRDGVDGAWSHVGGCPGTLAEWYGLHWLASQCRLTADHWSNYDFTNCRIGLSTRGYHCVDETRQWPMSIDALLTRFSFLILQTTKLALAHLAVAVQKLPERRSRYTQNYGRMISVAPLLQSSSLT